MKIFIQGVVQGVGFRPTVYRIAKRMGLKGYVRNNGSNVEICLDKEHKKFLTVLKNELPVNARIDDIKTEESNDRYDGFTILESSNGFRYSTIPPDTGICDDCLSELFDKKNRRYLYPFTNCTNCGARFSLIKDVPYDRKNTSMADFVLCESCRKEYVSPDNRRFHAQTISCPEHGPEYVLYDKNKKIVDGNIKRFAELLDKGIIGVLKGWGGMHICCGLNDIKKMRKWYKREYKPFAVMLKDMDTVRKYVEITDDEKKILTSVQKPVVLLKKKDDKKINQILEDISPGLPNIGVMLPYSGIHHILFHYMKNDGVVLTSANIHDEPMIINHDVFNLGADYYLLHNRKIVNRCDDSVIRTYKNRKFFIRKSRGWIPMKIDVDYDNNVVSAGAEQNISSSVSKNSAVYSSQYIGNVRYYPTFLFLEESTFYLMHLLGVKSVDGVGIDLHPRYVTRKFGEKISEKHDAELFEIQHHWAHAVSLMVDNKINESIVALTLDGTGYGNDNKIWGGEVLLSNYNSFERVGSLEEIPLIGGDASVKDPRRVVFAIFEKIGIDADINDYFDEKESDIFRKSMKNAPLTTSFGRILDALSCYLNICQRQTYDGEPAMKLEKYLEDGRLKYGFDVDIVNRERKIVGTIDMFRQLVDYTKNKSISKQKKSDLSYSFVYHLLKELIRIAVEKADEKGIKYIGITGGVSYNTTITKIVESFIKKSNKKFLTHDNIPNGDEGISVGQNAIVGHKLK